MLTPDWIDYKLDSMKVQAELEEGIIRDIARRIAKTGFVTETADWQAERARQAGILREDVIKRVAAATQKSESEIRKLFKEAEYKIFDGADTPTRGMQHIWDAALRKTCTEAKNLTKTIAITSQKTYIEAADMAHMEIMSGAFTYDTAITNAVKRAAQDGCRVRYPSGKTTSVEAAVRRAVLTGVNQTSGKLCEMRCDELDCDLVEVSAHYGARPSHAEWQGGVYSRSGKHPEYESLVDATGYGTGEGLMGWNCNHSISPFFPGLSKRNYSDALLDDMKNHTVTYNGKTMTDYEASQLQRGMERRIRQSKNRLIALDEQGKAATSLEQKNAFAAESVRLKAREGKLRGFCKQTGRRSDSLRTKTAGWNRSTSQKAVWANKKTVDNKGRSGIIKSGGKITESNFLRAGEYEKQAARYYAERLADDADVIAISKNAGFLIGDVAKIKKHMMSDEIKFKDGSVRVFDPDIDQALAWKRLIEGTNIKETDVLLLRHELEELTVMAERDLAYEDAHELANRLFNWEKAIENIVDTDELY